MRSTDLLAGALLLVCFFEPARAEDQQVMRAQAAKIITMSKLAPLLCPDLEADAVAIGRLLDHLGMTEQDVMDPKAFGVQDELVARDFAQSFKANGLQTCADALHYLGSGGLQLIREKPGAEVPP